MRNKYHDYRDEGSYFITICTYQRYHYFGEVRDGKLQLSDIGRLAHEKWLSLPAHHPHIVLDAFVVMPDHLHGILHIVAPNSDAAFPSDEIDRVRGGELQLPKRPPRPRKGRPKPKGPFRAFGPPDAGSISTVMRCYKAGVTRECGKRGWKFKWQNRFHDRILRSERALTNVRRYIEQNPLKWHLKYNRRLP